MNHSHLSEAVLTEQRNRMVEEQIRRRGVSDPRVLEAVRLVPRHFFVPADLVGNAYDDGPLPIGYAQTISQPYIVASMTEQLGLTPGARVLEIGTGSAYQTAVLAEIAREVYSIEVVPELAERARELLNWLGYRNVQTRVADGALGWPEEAPFDGIIVTAAAREIPANLVNQLAINGRMILPVWGSDPDYQDLVLIVRGEQEITREVLYPVRFVPLQGE